MVCLAETLQVVQVPEGLHIAAVRSNVINNLGELHHSVAIANPVNRDRLRRRERRAGLLPSIFVTALRRRASSIASTAFRLTLSAMGSRSRGAASAAQFEC